MQLTAQRAAPSRSGSEAVPCGAWSRERVAAEARALVEAKQAAHYWRSQHARAKQRAAIWQARCVERERELADAQQRIEQLQERVQELEREKAGLQQRNQDLLKAPFGKRSEKHPVAGEQSGQASPARRCQPRSRGGQPGACAHGRLKRSGLAVEEEWHEPPAGSCQCADCGLPYTRNGEQVSEWVEVRVQGYVRRVRRPRYRATCGCAQRAGRPVPEVLAALEPTLFRGTGYGLSVWVQFLLQVYWQRHPARAFEREWAERGVRLPASSLLGHLRDFLTWFEPLEAAIGAHQRQARVVHGDETSWVVHVRAEEGLNARCWLWACLSQDAVRFRVDAARSAEAAAQLFGQLGVATLVVLVCDRYSAYVKLAREHPGQFELAVCWVHARRDFVTLGRKRPDLQEWVEGILECIGRLYRLNAERLAEWDRQAGLEAQSEPFRVAQQRLEAEFAALFEQAEQDLRALPAADGERQDPRRGPLQSLCNHRAGLAVFLAKPFVPMDNNPVERALRRPVIGRKLSFGSHSADGAALQGALLSVFATLDKAGIDLQRWLQAFLRECASIGPQAVVRDPPAWLPWGMSETRLRALQAPWRQPPDGPAP